VKHLYKPIGNFTLLLARFLNNQHQHGINAYLSWTFATVLLLLAVFA